MGPAPMMATSVVRGWVMVMMGHRLACRLANLWAGVYGWLSLPYPFAENRENVTT